MRDGTCIKCGGGEVRQLSQGIYHSGHTAIMVNDGAMVRRAAAYETFLCTHCGYWEDYLSDGELLQRVRDGAGGWGRPR